jgi:hypothetical protein
MFTRHDLQEAEFESIRRTLDGLNLRARFRRAVRRIPRRSASLIKAWSFHAVVPPGPAKPRRPDGRALAVLRQCNS